MRLQSSALRVIVMMGACAPAVAWAQGGTPAVSSTRQFDASAEVKARYDSNPAQGSAATAEIRGIKGQDYILSPKLSVSAVQPFGSQSLFLYGSAGYDFHRENPRLDRQRSNITGGGAARQGLCRETLSGNYQAAQSELADLDLGTTENLRKTTSVSFAVQCALPTGPAVGVQLQRANTKNSADTVKVQDQIIKTGSLSLSYGRPSLGTLTAGVSYIGTEFPNRIIPGRPVGDGVFIQSYSLGYQRRFGSRVTVSASAGRTHLKREFAPPGAVQSINSSTYSADLTYGFGPRVEFTAHAERALVPSQLPGKTFDKRTGGAATVRYRPSRRFDVEAGFSRNDIDSNVDTASALLVASNSRLQTVFGTISYHPNDRWRFSADVRYADRETNLPNLNYNSINVGLTAGVSF